MDVFVDNIPEGANHVELQIFLKDKLLTYDIPAFDVYKKTGNRWAIITVPRVKNGQQFLARYGIRGYEKLRFQSSLLRCRMSNDRSRPDALKVNALLQREAKMNLKQVKQLTTGRTSETSRAHFEVQALMTGVWEYNHLGSLVFDEKYRDIRGGTVTFGKNALVIYLESATQVDGNWHCRIDISYAIIEHSIPSFEHGNFGSITLTLKSPPKLFEILDPGDLHRYKARQAVATPGMELAVLLGMSALGIGKPKPDLQVPKLERTCTLHLDHDRNIGLCMVYKLVIPVHQARLAFTFLKDSSVAEAHCWKTMLRHKPTQTIEKDIQYLEAGFEDSKLQFATKLQLLALVLEGTLTPKTAWELLPCICSIYERDGDEVSSRAVKMLGQQIPIPGPHVSSKKFDIKNLQDKLNDNAINAPNWRYSHYSPFDKAKRHEHIALTHKATVTPTGMLLQGPDETVLNRVLRKYHRHTNYFMRVVFADEDGLSVFHDPKASQCKVYDRFRQVLKEGITIAGRRFEFLGFSNASLKCHQTWFMAPFRHGDRMVCAKDIIKDLGDFTHFRCSAKCAARIGQAFSDTIFSIPIPSTALVSEDVEDVKRNSWVFSDGCGTMSRELFGMLWRALPPPRRQKCPTVIQIRFRGAKGVLSLNSSLSGEQLNIRNSMTKYIAREAWRDLELCDAAYRPLKMYLNHQFIKIMEDLGVSPENFLEIQGEARNMLEKVIQHPLNAASFLEYSHSGVHAKVPQLFRMLYRIGLPFQADHFLTDIVEIAAMSSLRSMKYRARIPIEKGYLLFGIMDETNTLKEGEVYIATEDETPSGRQEKNILVGDGIVVTRAPALHPGDVQIVTGVDVAEGSPLRHLHNCIVFSQQGARDLPSQLGGGDLDGDKFHIIYDPRLRPKFTALPSDYAAVTPTDLGRSVEVGDIVDFFIDHMINDNLGRISNIHKIRADKNDPGTLDEECRYLAQLASDAVDFSKSGVPVDPSKIPRGTDHVRPDFMAPGHSFVINDLGAIALQDPTTDDIDEPDSLSILDPAKSRFTYYRSEKILGRLYRNIDEKEFFRRMQGKFANQQRASGSESLIQKLEAYIDRQSRAIQWEHYIEFAEELRESYEYSMSDIMNTLKVHRGKPLTELEVFSGNILGMQARASNSYIRAANVEVQARFDHDVGMAISRIVHGDEDDDDDEALPRAIACFKIALRTQGWENWVTLKSWKYVAAAVCLEQLERFLGGTLPSV